MGFNHREAKLAQRVREVEEQNQMLRHQLRFISYLIEGCVGKLIHGCTKLYGHCLKCPIEN